MSAARPPEGASLVRPVSPVFLAVPAVLALALAALWFGPGPAAGWRQWQAPQPQPPNLDDVQAAALRFNPAAGAAYPQVLERPLLNPARRPQASASAGPEAAPPTAIEEATMQGIVAGATLTGVFLEEKGEARFVRIGEKVGDWALESIRGREIVFRRGAEQRKIELAPANPESDQGKGAPAAQGQPPAAAPGRRGANASPPPPRATPAAAPAPAPAPAPAAPPPAAPSTPSPAAPAASAAPLGAFGGSAPQPAPSNTR